MLTRLRRGHVQLASSGGQLAALLVGAKVGTPGAWALSAALVAGISLFAWLLAMRHVRAIGDTPTSRVASAAQGYVELRGTGRALGEALRARDLPTQHSLRQLENVVAGHVQYGILHLFEAELALRV